MDRFLTLLYNMLTENYVNVHMYNSKQYAHIFGSAVVKY